MTAHGLVRVLARTGEHVSGIDHKHTIPYRVTAGELINVCFTNKEKGRRVSHFTREVGGSGEARTAMESSRLFGQD
jgi:hypothetical protein